jgi:hypothetical protein
MGQLVFLSQDAVEGRLRSQIAALIGQSWHDLTRRQMTEFIGIGDGQHLGTLDGC